MTPQQQARLGEIAVWVGTADDLLRQAYAAAYGAGMLDALDTDTRQEIAKASIVASTAARRLQRELQAMDADGVLTLAQIDGEDGDL